MLQVVDLRVLFFLAGALVYGVAGSPTPDSFGMAEGLAGFFFLMAIAPIRAFHAVTGGQVYGWALAAQCFLLYGLVVPLVAGLVNGNNPVNMLRDIVPFLFLLLPLAMQDWRDRPEKERWMLVVGLVLTGLAFAARVSLPLAGGVLEGWPENWSGNWSGNWPEAWFRGQESGEGGLYLAIAPCVVFAAIFLAANAGGFLYRNLTLRHCAYACLCLCGAVLAFSALLVTLQRASIGLAIIALAGLLFVGVIYRPVRMILPLAVLGVILLILAPFVAGGVAELLHKQLLVGGNMRVQEAVKVLEDLGGSVWTILFGKGWGAMLSSPAVGGVSVNFTHNLLTAYWLKTGLFGVGLLLAYLLPLGWGLGGVMRARPFLGVALAVPLLINMTLYASYKSLDFGLILVVLAVFAPCATRLRRGAA